MAITKRFHCTNILAESSFILLQPMGILMVVVGAKFVTVNGHLVPVAWIIAGLVLIGAIITSKKHGNKQCVLSDWF